MPQEINRNEEAAAETIGFLYIFAIVMLSISMIYVMGYPMLQSSMDESIFESTEQSFIVLQSDMKMVAFDQVPVKSLRIQLQGATLSVTKNSNITITIDYLDGTPQNVTHYDTGEIEYQKSDKFLTYENGGVWKRYPGSIMVSNPHIYSTIEDGSNSTTIGIVSIQGASSVGGNGIATLSMKYNENNKSVIIKPSGLVNVTLIINSTYAKDWENYLESRGFNTNLTGSSLTAMRNNTMLVVGQHMVDVDIT
ncbi:MAG: hypothetical protein WCE94_05785 [Candidatus Methanoperedens sp.]